ncbi:uncharacterized protein LOC143235481 [Tachypleus tridentatus]|uniref:uncharacterized protein LOC143235481 n=1 Tax=Tachypleus tridentatus TaxID=6853 RepID=UPI003FCFAF6F
MSRETNKNKCKIKEAKFLPWSTVSAVIMKWKGLGATTAQQLSGRPHKLIEWDCQLLKHVKIVCPQLQHKLLSSKLPLEATLAEELLVGSFMKWVSMAKQLHISLRSPCTMPSFGWNGVKHTAIGLCSSGNVFSGVMNHASPSGSLMDKSGFGRCQENATCLNV